MQLTEKKKQTGRYNQVERRVTRICFQKKLYLSGQYDIAVTGVMEKDLKSRKDKARLTFNTLNETRLECLIVFHENQAAYVHF